ncbi:MAG: tRNA (adenine-N1)-methyltransferase [Candidatus Altarchaeaceae archaeon]
MYEGKILFDKKGRSYLFSGKDIHTKDGVIKKEEVEEKNFGEIVKTHLNVEYYLVKTTLADIIKKAERAPQAMTLKDLSIISGFIGLKSGSRIVNAGTGSGIADIFFSNIVYPEKVVSYEIREDFANVARKNFEKFNIKNVEIKMKNIYDGIDEDNLDAIILDLPEPWRVIEDAAKKLKISGYLVAYTPSIEQAKKFRDNEILKEKFLSETIECIVRSWDMKAVRPHSKMIAHTGFITFSRLMKR